MEQIEQKTGQEKLGPSVKVYSINGDPQPIALRFYTGYHPAWCSLQTYTGNVFSGTLQYTQQTILTKELRVKKVVTAPSCNCSSEDLETTVTIKVVSHKIR